MSREEAIKELTELLPEEFLSEYVDAIKMAIKALKQEFCEDCISRQEVLDALDKSKYSNAFCEEHHIDWSINLGMAHIVVNELKPVTPQPKMGHWIREANIEDVYDTAGVKTWGVRHQCDRCNFSTIIIEDFGYYKYCPNCGAKMQEE